MCAYLHLPLHVHMCVYIHVCVGDSNSVSFMHYLIMWLSQAAGVPCP